ncbi:MAG TPA: 6-phosphogluconolactonase [Xanthomonadales bacterium]|nr:6-phosphogluconolactonase [Xanthomonadales bacterium]
MFEQIEEIIKKKNIFSHKNQGITVAKIEAQPQGLELAKDILYKIVDRKTVLYLSGGSTPKTLYTKLAQEEVLMPGAVGQVDERYGEPMHQNSNQLMIKGTGLMRYLEIRDIPFYPILQPVIPAKAGIQGSPIGVGDDNQRKLTAEIYDQKIRELNTVFPKSVAILGIGADGHTAGMPALNSKLKDQKSKIYDTFGLITEYDDKGEVYGERVTMTFLGLEMLDLMILLVFGTDKKEALDQMFEKGREEEIPARFYTRPEVAQKTLLITDQNV